MSGPWKVMQFGLNWYVYRNEKRKKKIGPVKMRGRNYYDVAVKEAERRNKLAE